MQSRPWFPPEAVYELARQIAQAQRSLTDPNAILITIEVQSNNIYILHKEMIERVPLGL